MVTPGEPVRVTGIRDVIEPRVKFDNDAQVFPGVIGPVVTVGDGVTHRLSGMAVLAAAAYEGTIRAGTGVQRSAILDMWGTGAAASRFSGAAPSGVEPGNSRRLGRTGSAPGDSAGGVSSRVQARRNDQGT